MLITFERISNCGKTTLVEMLKVLKIKDELSRFGSSNAHGMGVTDICNVLQRENLQTIFYMKSALHKEYSHTTQEMLLKQKIYSYIDSGFPCIFLVLMIIK